MPIYEYECRGCGDVFELLVLKDTDPACPVCQGKDLERRLSSFAVNSPELSQARVQSAIRAKKTSRGYKDEKVAAVEHEIEHINEQRDGDPLKLKPPS